jgi:NADH-quinone oxidoreductase subunit N
MMFFTDPEEDTVTVSIPSQFTASVIWIAALTTLALGVFPTPLLDLIASLATFVR